MPPLRDARRVRCECSTCVKHQSLDDKTGELFWGQWVSESTRQRHINKHKLTSLRTQRGFDHDVSTFPYGYIPDFNYTF